MLFSWPSAKKRVFWVHNTHVSLSVGFISADGALFAIEDMAPDTDDYHYSTELRQMRSNSSKVSLLKRASDPARACYAGNAGWIEAEAHDACGRAIVNASVPEISPMTTQQLPK